ncbi:hypothetical protein XENOCAPTIV_020422, partial [Xenoophorus captivus]
MFSKAASGRCNWASLSDSDMRMALHQLHFVGAQLVLLTEILSRGDLTQSDGTSVDELYEAFCIQSRLRDGAIRMKQAFSSSPSTKGTKESIAEVNRRYKEYTEVL